MRGIFPPTMMLPFILRILSSIQKRLYTYSVIYHEGEKGKRERPSIYTINNMYNKYKCKIY